MLDFLERHVGSTRISVQVRELEVVVGHLRLRPLGEEKVLLCGLPGRLLEFASSEQGRRDPSRDPPHTPNGSINPPHQMSRRGVIRIQAEDDLQVLVGLRGCADLGPPALLFGAPAHHDGEREPTTDVALVPFERGSGVTLRLPKHLLHSIVVVFCVCSLYQDPHRVRHALHDPGRGRGSGLLRMRDRKTDVLRSLRGDEQDRNEDDHTHGNMLRSDRPARHFRPMQTLIEGIDYGFGTSLLRNPT